MHDSEILLKELGGKLPEGKGCINFDFACLFPYDNQEVLTLAARSIITDILTGIM